MSRPPSRGFPRAEFETRAQRAQNAMAEAGMSCLLLTTEAELRYFSGFHTPFWQSPTRPWFLILPAAGAPVAVIPEIGAALMAETWVEDLRTWPAPVPEDDGVSLLAEALAPYASRGFVGLPMGHETHLRMPLGDWERLRGLLPDMTLFDATALVQRQRMIKSEAEIAKIAHICEIASKTFDAVPEVIRPGLRRDELFRAFRRLALSFGADEVPYLVGGAGQGGYSDVISPPVGTPLEAGDLVMMDTGMTWDGYFCDFDRNWSIGPPSEEVSRAHDLLWQATEAALTKARAGATTGELFAAMNAVLGQGEGAIGRMGHGLGMQLTEQPSIMAGGNVTLAPGMVLTLEPSVELGRGRVMVTEENIVITESAPRLLSRRAPAHLPFVPL